MKHMDDYEILCHVEMPKCSIRIISMKEAEHVALHCREKCAHKHDAGARSGGTCG